MGGGGVDIYVNEIYGSLINPQYRPLVNVTVTMWNAWGYLDLIGFLMIILISKAAIILPEQMGVWFINYLAMDTKFTSGSGWARADSHGIGSLWLFNIAKDGYYSYRDPSFKIGSGGGGVWTEVHFTMAEKGWLIKS